MLPSPRVRRTASNVVNEPEPGRSPTGRAAPSRIPCAAGDEQKGVLHGGVTHGCRPPYRYVQVTER